MCSNDVHLTVLRRCGTDVAGLWVSGGALLRSVEEQQRLHFRSTVRRAAPCTTTCWPQLHALSPCSSTRPITPARTLWLFGGMLFLHADEISKCCSSFARRWDLRRQARSFVGTTRPPCSRYVKALLASRYQGCCSFAPYEGMCCGGAADVSRARVCRRRAVSPSPYHRLVTSTRIGCVIMFLERDSAIIERECRLPSGSGA